MSSSAFWKSGPTGDRSQRTGLETLRPPRRGGGGLVTRALTKGALPPRREAKASGHGTSEKNASESLDAAFDRALATVRMVFQPILRAADGSLYGYEALLRTSDPVLSNPGAILEAAEKLSKIHALSRRIRTLTAQRFSRGDDADAPRVIFVNLHADDFVDENLASSHSALAPLSDRVVFEITERASVGEIPDIRARVAELRELGYRIAIDDLGAGHSRSNLFRPMDTDFVKLDMSLVRGIERDASKRELIASIIRSCRQQEIAVIGEGIESAEEAAGLTELGCDLLQGFYFGRPR